MKLNELLDCDCDVVINDVTDDSRKVKKGSVFVAIKGFTADGNDYIDAAIKNGASAIITENKIKKEVPIFVVKDANLKYNLVLNKLNDNVLDKLKLIGVTGTDGKTTVSEIIYQLLSNYDECGYIGTNGIKMDKLFIENDFTTPLPHELFDAFKEFVIRKAKYVSLEVSSERLSTKKMDGINFDVAIFTNLTRDHLDTHKTMENYALAKARLFMHTKKEGLGIVNIDDEYSSYFINNSNAKILTYGINKKADIYATNIMVKLNRLEFDINGILGTHHIITNISGYYNVYNIMASILCLNHFGYDMVSIIKNISSLKPIDARQTSIELGQNYQVIIDYAHTANAVRNLVNYVKKFAKGNIIAVVGAGGSRDLRRAIDMGIYCTENLYFSYFTIEDARYDDPDELLRIMTSEAKKNNYKKIISRDEAIREAILNAKENDTILILGKGLESYQKTGGKLIPRKNDLELATDIIKERLKKGVLN